MTLNTTKAQDAKAFFMANGYAVIKQLIPLTVVEEIRAFLASQTVDAIESANAELGCSSSAELVEIAGAIASGNHRDMATLSKATRDTMTGHFPLAVRLSNQLWQIPLLPDVMEILRACLNTQNLFMHLPPTARFVLPKNKHAGVPAHQDASYNEHMSSFLTMWVPLVDITKERGGVIVYEGSQAAAIQSAPDSANAYWRAPVATAHFPPRHMTINAGDILLLNPAIIHGSAANSSDETRFSIDFRFFGQHSTSTKHCLDLQTAQVFESKTLTL